MRWNTPLAETHAALLLSRLELPTSGSVLDLGCGWSEPADRVLCIGATHAWGGTEAALGALVETVKPGGRLLFGDGFWQRAPGTAAVAIFGDEVVPLSAFVRLAHSTGWRVFHMSEADQHERDDFESTWRLGRHRWLAAHPDAAGSPKLREELQEGVLGYLDVYRGVLGFCYLVLGR